MNVLIIGGTGLLGLEAARQLRIKQHHVIGIALPPLPAGVILPPGYEVIYGNYLDMADEELACHLHNVQAVIFAAGIDERVEAKTPIDELYDKYNVRALERVLRLAKENGVRSAVILGSYFTYVARKHPGWNLGEYHPYIRSRIKQQSLALSFAEDGKMHVAILELPYIFGTQPGREPVWTILIEQIMAMKKRTYYPRGGTAMVTVPQVGQAIVGALTKNVGGNVYPIGYYNLTWRQMLTLFHENMGIKRPIITVPTWLYQIGVHVIVRKKEAQGITMGLNMRKFSRVMTSNSFIDRDEGARYLGVKPDNLQQAIADSVRVSLEVLQGKKLIKMKAE